MDREVGVDVSSEREIIWCVNWWVDVYLEEK